MSAIDIDRIMQRDDDLAAYYAKGYSMRETAAHFRISLERVRQILRRSYPNLIRPAHVGMCLSPRRRLQLKESP